MCKYCKYDYFDNKNILNKKVGIGAIGTIRVEMNLGSSDEDGIGRMNTVVWHEWECHGTPLLDIRTKIKYCPMCGNKLTES